MSTEMSGQFLFYRRTEDEKRAGVVVYDHLRRWVLLHHHLDLTSVLMAGQQEGSVQHRGHAAPAGEGEGPALVCGYVLNHHGMRLISVLTNLDAAQFLI